MEGEGGGGHKGPPAKGDRAGEGNAGGGNTYQEEEAGQKGTKGRHGCVGQMVEEAEKGALCLEGAGVGCVSGLGV